MEKLIILVIIGIFSLVSSIIKNAREREKEARGRELAQGGVAPDRKQAMQSRLEAFLKEVGVHDDVVPQRPVPVDVRADQRNPSLAPGPEGQPVRRRPARPPRRREPGREQLRRQAEQRSVRKPAAPPTRPVTQRVGSGIDDHVELYLARQIGEHVDRPGGEPGPMGVAESVASHLGTSSVQAPPVRLVAAGEPLNAMTIRELLQTPEGVRQAILLNEVLQRPQVLRRLGDSSGPADR